MKNEHFSMERAPGNWFPVGNAWGKADVSVSVYVSVALNLTLIGCFAYQTRGRGFVPASDRRATSQRQDGHEEG